jgi:hypothetical protein
MRHYPLIVAGVPPIVRMRTFAFRTGVACWTGSSAEGYPRAWRWHEVHPVEYDGYIEAFITAFPTEIQFEGLCGEDDFLIPDRFGGKVTRTPVRLDRYRDQWDRDFINAVMGSGIAFVPPRW